MSDENSFKAAGYTVTVKPDEIAESPREWDNLGVMVCWHRRYELGDQKAREEFPTPAAFEEWYREHKREVAVLLPLYLIDHSGLSMRCRDFSDCDPGGWDSGQVGWIYTTRAAVLENWSRKQLTRKLRAQAEEVLRREVATYDQLLTGDVWWYCVESADGEHVDSCGGFYGYEYAREQAIEAAQAARRMECEAEEQTARIMAL